jgi:hypothetical protein
MPPIGCAAARAILGVDSAPRQVFLAQHPTILFHERWRLAIPTTDGAHPLSGVSCRNRSRSVVFENTVGDAHYKRNLCWLVGEPSASTPWGRGSGDAPKAALDRCSQWLQNVALDER